MAKSNKKPAARSTRTTSKSKPAKPSSPVARTSRPAKEKAVERRPRPAVAVKPTEKTHQGNKPAPKARPPVETPPAPVIKARPGKNLAGFNARELEHFRELLLQKRRELVGDMYSMEREALTRTGENLSNLPIHMADMGTDNYEQEFTLGLMEKDRQLLREINTALIKIQDGTYGICEGTGKPISKGRLEVAPWARFSIEHARKMENRGTRG